MATINFYLDKPDTSGQCPILMIYQSRGRKFKYYTKEKVVPKYWDKKRQRVKSKSSAPEVNDILNDCEERLKKMERELRLKNGSVTFDEVKRNFLGERMDKLGMFEFFDKMLKDHSATLQHATLQKYRTLIADLQDFEKKKKTTLTFQSIDNKFYNRFVEFLSVEKKNTQNTVAKKISTLKTLLSRATKAKANKNLAYQDFTVKRVKTEKVYLTNDELFRLYNMDLSNNPKLERVRDLFCFGCFTGLRYSDIKSLKFEEVHFKEDVRGEMKYHIKIQVQKTKSSLHLPLNKYALSIFDKYKEKKSASFKVINEDFEKHSSGTKVFPSISIQKMNDYIKELAKKAGINESISMTKYIGTERIDEVFPKYELLATHSARRTFAILSLEKGMRIEVLQKILGHGSIRTTMKYVFILDKVKEDEMSRVWG